MPKTTVSFDETPASAPDASAALDIKLSPGARPGLLPPLAEGDRVLVIRGKDRHRQGRIDQRVGATGYLVILDGDGGTPLEFGRKSLVRFDE